MSLEAKTVLAILVFWGFFALARFLAKDEEP